jgi:zinc/manganese transport system substrate-binding protein
VRALPLPAGRPPRLLKLASLAATGAAMASCGTSSPGARGAAGDTPAVQVVAAENFWGSIAAQLGGDRVHVTSIITDPNADPHSYEPTAADARRISTAGMVIVNGTGYDPWADKLLSADAGSRTELNVGNVLGLKAGDNPHRWYNPTDVETIAATITADYSKRDPADAAYFQRQQNTFNSVALGSYHSLINEVHARYSGVPVGASESIFSMMAPALGLNLITPYSFLKATSEGTDVSPSDKSTIDTQIRTHQIKIYVFNSQNTTPDVQTQLNECRAAGIPTATITETLVPASSTFQAWQTSELQGILSALQKATAR